MIMNKCCVLFVPAIVAVMLFLTTKVESLKCVQCLDCDHNLPDPTECIRVGKAASGNDYPTCMKILTKYSDREVVTRQCSIAPPGTDLLCSEVKGFEQCIYHCNHDGCNGARASSLGGKATAWLTLLVYLALRFIHV